MDIEGTALATASSVIVGVLLGCFTGWQATRRTRRSAYASRRGDAAEALRDEVWSLRDMVWDASIGTPVDGRRVARTIRAFETRVTRYEDLLPRGSSHLRRSAREAISCAFGSPGGAALWAEAAELPADEANGHWVDVAVTWLEYVARRLHDWQDNPGVRELTIEPFYSWRRDEDAHYFAPRRVTPQP
jgi:hypothetical protein